MFDESIRMSPRPCPGARPVVKLRCPGAAPRARGYAWLFSLKLDGLAGDPVSRPGAEVYHQAPLVPAPPGWDDVYSVTLNFLIILDRMFLTNAMNMSTIKQPAGGRYRERQRAARGANRLDVPTPRHHSIAVTAVRVTRPGVSLQTPRRWVDL